MHQQRYLPNTKTPLFPSTPCIHKCTILANAIPRFAAVNTDYSTELC